MENFFTYLFILVGIYVILGLLFSIFILYRAITEIDPGTKDSGLGMKLLLLPGLIAFWPVFFNKWKKVK